MIEEIQVQGQLWYRVGDRTCTRCELVKNRAERPVVPNLVNPRAEIALLGLSPAKDEIKKDLPFIGDAGKKIRDALGRANVSVQDVSFLNSALCWPPNNKLNKAITTACSVHFDESLKLMPNLKVVLLLGGEACKAVSGVQKTVMKDLYLRPFKLEKYGEILFIPNYHPASILYNPTPPQIALFYEGIKQSIEIYKSLKELTKPVRSVIIKDEELLKSSLDFLGRQPFLAYDSEFTSLQFKLAELLTLHFSSEENTALGFPYMWWNGEAIVPYWPSDTMSYIDNWAKFIFTNPNTSICGQNIKIDSLVARRFGLEKGITNIVFDTQAASFVLDSNLPMSLEDLIAREIPERAGRKARFWGDVDKKNWYKYFTLDQILEYGNDDAMDTFKIANILAKRL